MGMALGTKKPASDINVTPLIDVVLVLLIIFMVLTPLAEKQKYLRVPEYTPNPEVIPPDATPPDQVVLTALQNGNVLLNKQEMPVMEAMSKLTPAFKDRYLKVLFFNAEDKAKYEQVMYVLDQAHIAGVNTIAIMTDAPMTLEAAPAEGEAAPAPAPQ
jgi:biopolymer transport protein TolR